MSKTFDTKFMQYAVNHVNQDHADAMLSIVKHFTCLHWAQKAVLLSYNTKAMQISVEGNDGQSQDIEISFPNPLKNAKEFRPVLIGILKQAKQ